METHTTCGAKTTSTPDGAPCSKVAGWRTDHPGQGRCYLHGGGSPIKHGRYSKITRPRIKAWLEEFESDPDPLNLEAEVKLLRALIIDYVERFDAYQEALQAWHESFNDPTKAAPAKPRQVADILSVGKFIGDIGGLVEKIHKQRTEGTITMATLNRVIEEFGEELVKAAQETIDDTAARAHLLASVERRWGSVRLDPGTGRS